MAPFVETLKDGFAHALGSIGAFVLYMIVSLALLIPGYLIVASELKKKKADRSTPKLVGGFLLAFLGAAVGLGMAGGMVLEMLGEAVLED